MTKDSTPVTLYSLPVSVDKGGGSMQLAWKILEILDRTGCKVQPGKYIVNISKIKQ